MLDKYFEAYDVIGNAWAELEHLKERNSNDEEFTNCIFSIQEELEKLRYYKLKSKLEES